MKGYAISIFTAILLCGLSFAHAADEPVDMHRVRELRARLQKGENLSAEEQAYYDRGAEERKVRQKQRGQPLTKRPSGDSKPATASEGKTSTGFVPLSDMSAEDRYKGEDGGLYGGGRNTPPEVHLKAAMELAAKIQPLDAEGKPSPDGKIVLVTQGMSNTTIESGGFIKMANADPRKNAAVLLINGGQGGIDSRKWVADMKSTNGDSAWDTLEKRIKDAGATPQQVQVVWMKHAIARVKHLFGDFPKHATQLKDDTAEILQMLKQRFPNLKLAYISSRSYAGYASNDLNPEPFAYEVAFTVRWLIQDQIKGVESLSYASGKAPLLLWGPYLWADGEKGRKTDDLIYKREDYRDDGKNPHPSDLGRQKIAEQLVKFFTTDPTAITWFVKQ